MTWEGAQGTKSAAGLEVKAGFWQRQFQPQATTQQIVFDVLFGVAIPILCFIFDPVVFRGNIFGGRPLFGQLQFLAYAIAFIEISTLIVWLWRREHLGAHALAIGGFLYTGALVSLTIGFAILPFSLLGIIFFGLGLLGFIPFLTALVFWRNGRRAAHLQDGATSGKRKLWAFLLGMIFVIGLPLAAHLQLQSVAQASLRKILEGDARDAEAATEQLRRINYLTDTGTDSIVWAYDKEPDPARRERLASAYLKITGENIDARLAYLID